MKDGVMVKVIEDYRDIQKSMIFHKGEKHEVTKARADELVAAGKVVIESDPENKTKSKTAS